MPSYIFVRMRMNQELHFLISSLQYVVSFVGADRGGRTMSGQMQACPSFGRSRARGRALSPHSISPFAGLARICATNADER
jgi:hypothetical protein